MSIFGCPEEIFGRRSGEKFRQLHLWLSNAWYSTEGTIWTVGESFAFSLLTSCSVHSGMIRDTSLAIKVGHIFLGTHVSLGPESGRLCSPHLLSHHPGMAIARLPPEAPGVCVEWCSVDGSWSPRHGSGLSRPVGVIGWVLAPPPAGSTRH